MPPAPAQTADLPPQALSSTTNIYHSCSLTGCNQTFSTDSDFLSSSSAYSMHTVSKGVAGRVWGRRGCAVRITARAGGRARAVRQAMAQRTRSRVVVESEAVAGGLERHGQVCKGVNRLKAPPHNAAPRPESLTSRPLTDGDQRPCSLLFGRCPAGRPFLPAARSRPAPTRNISTRLVSVPPAPSNTYR
jgi:hypothetical protein